MGAGYLVDSNAVIDLGLGRLPTAGAMWLEQIINQREVSISVITRIELLTKTQPAAEFIFMQALVNSVVVLPLDEPVIQQTIALRQQYRIKLPDAIIAATALAHGLPLLTRNVSDFQRVGGLNSNQPARPGAIASYVRRGKALSPARFSCSTARVRGRLSG